MHPWVPERHTNFLGWSINVLYKDYAYACCPSGNAGKATGEMTGPQMLPEPVQQ